MDGAARQTPEEYEPELGDPSAFRDGVYRSIQIAYVPDCGLGPM